jgi:hypothetical protein
MIINRDANNKTTLLILLICFGAKNLKSLDRTGFPGQGQVKWEAIVCK